MYNLVVLILAPYYGLHYTIINNMLGTIHGHGR